MVLFSTVLFSVGKPKILFTQFREKIFTFEEINPDIFIKNPFKMNVNLNP